MKTQRKTPLSPLWLTSPKYQLGQLICYIYTVDDDLDNRHGQSFHELGIITGVVWNPPFWLKNPGWIYTICLVKSNSHPETIGMQQEVQESELISVNLGVTNGRH